MWSRRAKTLPVTCACTACGVLQEMPQEVSFFPCCVCRAALDARFNGPWAWLRRALCVDRSGTSHHHRRTPWTATRPWVGSAVRLTPCCLYYDHTCIADGPLKSTADEGLLVRVDRDSMRSNDELLVVKVGGTTFRYQLGCIEEAHAAQMYDDVFSKFAAPSEVDGKLLMGFAEFDNYAHACGHLVEWDVFRAICAALWVNPSHGLTAGDFRRMYCQFESDVREDHSLALFNARATHYPLIDQGPLHFLANDLERTDGGARCADTLGTPRSKQPKDKRKQRRGKSSGGEDSSILLASKFSEKLEGGAADEPCLLGKHIFSL